MSGLRPIPGGSEAGSTLTAGSVATESMIRGHVDLTEPTGGAATESLVGSHGALTHTTSSAGGYALLGSSDGGET